MKLLVDTEAFIFWTTWPEKLPTKASDAIRSRENTVYLSLVSPWEMQIKFMLKKLDLRKPPVVLAHEEVNDGAFTLLPIAMAHVDVLTRLPSHHRDPFDRLLIAQAMHENLILVTGDEEIIRYPVPTLWR